MPKCLLTHRLQVLRLWLLHLIGSVHCYIMGQVLHSLELELNIALDQASNLEAIIKAHDNFVKQVFVRSLQPKNPNIKTAVLQVVSLCAQLRHSWDTKPEEFQLKQMEMTYLKCHWFLGNSLRSAVENETHREPSNKTARLLFKATNFFTEFAWQKPRTPTSSFPSSSTIESIQNPLLLSKTRSTQLNDQNNILELYIDHYFSLHLPFIHDDEQILAGNGLPCHVLYLRTKSSSSSFEYNSSESSLDSQSIFQTSSQMNECSSNISLRSSEFIDEIKEKLGKYKSLCPHETSQDSDQEIKLIREKLENYNKFQKFKDKMKNVFTNKNLLNPIKIFSSLIFKHKIKKLNEDDEINAFIENSERKYKRKRKSLDIMTKSENNLDI